MIRKTTEVKYGGQFGEISGWGVGDTDNESCVLRKTSLIVYKPEKCPFKAFYLFCAGDPKGRRDACVVNACKNLHKLISL